MYACAHCGSTRMFLAFKDGILVKVLEDHEDVEGLDQVQELLCTECNVWFPNPALGDAQRVMTGELVTITGLRGQGTIKVVATGITLPFHYDTHTGEAARALAAQPPDTVAALREFAGHHDHVLALRVKEEGNENTWVYRLDQRRLWRDVERERRVAPAS